MAKRKCSAAGCRAAPQSSAGLCSKHFRRQSIDGFLSRTYTLMKSRTKGGSTKRPDLYKGKQLLPKDVFVSWSSNHPVFLRLFKTWAMASYDRKLTPTINRMNSDRGYTLDNMEWITNSQNCGLSGAVRSFNRRRAVYELLGEQNV